MISRRAAIVVVAAAASLGAARTAYAQEMPKLGPGPIGDTTQLGDSENSEAPPTLSPRSVKLFDSRRSIRSYQIDVGPLWNRKVQDTTPAEDRTGFEHGAPLAGEIAVGTVHTTPAKPFFLVGNMKTLFRVIDDKSFSWALYHQELGGGLSLGPFELEARLRLGILTADIIHAQPSAQLFSPGVSAGLGIRFGALRIDAHANADYLWRWFGPDYMLRSITIGVRLDIPPPPNPFQSE